MLIGDLIRRRALMSPQRVFWEEGGLRRTYGELNRAADRVAQALVAAGLGPGAMAAMVAHGGYDYATVHFGAAKAGLVLAHLNARAAAPELAALGRHCAPAAVFFAPEVVPALAAARGGMPAPAHWVCLGGAAESPGWATPLADWLALHPAGADVEPPPPACDPGDPFQLLYTSGTTGFPKGALISHRAKLRQGTTHSINLGLQPGDRVLSALPFYHQYAQWLLLVAVPLTGATVVARPRFDPADTWGALRGGGITHLPAVPTMLYRLLDDPAAEGPPPPTLRNITYGAAPIERGRVTQLRERFPHLRLFQGFGQTETGYCLGLMDEHHDRRPETLGKPDIFSEVRLLDGEGREVAPGEVGEIVARTPYLMNGYHGDDEATAAYFAFGPGWGRTGDLARRDEEGFYTLAGRARELIISGGENIYPLEVERVLAAHPAVAEAAVFGVPHPDWGEAPAAAVILHPGKTATSEDLTAHCRARLAAFKCPRHFTFPSDLPRTSNGKVRKSELREGWRET